MADPTAAAVVNQDALKTWDVSAADADTGSVAITHGFVDATGTAVAPEIVDLTPILAGVSLGDWSVATTATTITVTKTAADGGDPALPVIRVTAMLPHTLLRD